MIEKGRGERGCVQKGVGGRRFSIHVLPLPCKLLYDYLYPPQCSDTHAKVHQLHVSYMRAGTASHKPYSPVLALAQASCLEPGSTFGRKGLLKGFLVDTSHKFGILLDSNFEAFK